MNPLVSIITVTKNNAFQLEKTINSVIVQTYKNIEYIIIDGKSSDCTDHIISKYFGYIDFWVSEKDTGIYHAMNKGIRAASGNWLLFLNAGDVLKSQYVIERLVGNHTDPKIVFIYGDHEVVKNKTSILKKAGKIKQLWKGMQFSHQSVLIKREYAKNNQFCENERIVGDYKFFYNAIVNNCVNTKYVPITVASISAGGVSDIHRIKSLLRRRRIAKSNLTSEVYYFVLILLEIIKKPIKILIC